MAAILVPRLQRIVATLFAIVTVVFVAVRLVPGDPALVLLGDVPATPEIVAAIRHDLGVDQPVWVQYVNFVSRLVQGDLGYSYRKHVAAVDLIGAQYFYTVHLGLTAFVLALVLGVLGGTLAARFRGSKLDLAIMTINGLLVSAPFFWLGLLLLFLFSVQLRWLPLTGAGSLDDPGDLLRHLVVPALAVGLRAAAVISRVTRSAVLEVLGEDYVRTAWAKGLTSGVVFSRHVLGNSALMIIGIAGVELVTLLAGSMVVEVVFSRPGLGRIFIEALVGRDFPMIQACVLVLGVVVTMVNVLTDLAYSIADPRVHAR